MAGPAPPPPLPDSSFSKVIVQKISHPPPFISLEDKNYCFRPTPQLISDPVFLQVLYHFIYYLYTAHAHFHPDIGGKLLRIPHQRE